MNDKAFNVMINYFRECLFVLYCKWNIHSL